MSVATAAKSKDTESGGYDHRKAQAKKVLHHLEVHAKFGGGHRVEHHFDNSGSIGGFHEPEIHEFNADAGPAALDHIRKHAGMNVSEAKHDLGSKVKTGAEEAIAESENE